MCVDKQLSDELNRIREKHLDAQAIAYFQAHSNTYAPVSKLGALFETALDHEGICGISIATRADCLDNDVLEYLSDLNSRTRLTVELGLQTSFDERRSLLTAVTAFQNSKRGFCHLKRVEFA